MSTETNEALFSQIVLEVFKVSALLNVKGDELTEEFGLSSARWKVLGPIDRSEVPLTVAQIGRVMGQSRQATQRVVDIMVKDGLLVMTDNPHHKKAKYVEMTEKGEVVYASLAQKQRVWAAKGADAIDKSELELTLSTMKKLSGYIGTVHEKKEATVELLAAKKVSIVREFAINVLGRIELSRLFLQQFSEVLCKAEQMQCSCST